MMHDRERRPVSASAISGKRRVIASAAVEPHAVAILAFDDRKPSCLISCSHRSPEGNLSVFVGRHGAMHPAGNVRSACGLDRPRGRKRKALLVLGRAATDCVIVRPHHLSAVCTATVLAHRLDSGLPQGPAGAGAGLKGLRDRALLLIGFAGALRRSELVAFNIEDIEETPDGMKITIRHSKTDQEGAGQTIAIPFGKIACPVAALKEWITATGIGSGALFRSVKRHGKAGERPIKACLTL